MLCEQLHVGEGGTGLRKTGGSLDIIGTGVRNALAKSDLLIVGQQAGFDDDLQELTLAGGLDGGDLIGDLGPLALLGPADVDDHVHFVGAVIHGIGGHEALCGSGGVAIGEADDGADGQAFAHIFLGLLDEGGGDADGSGGVLHAVVANGLNLSPCGGLRQQSVVALGENFLEFHIYFSF